jgi:hypothetical protein
MGRGHGDLQYPQPAALKSAREDTLGEVLWGEAGRESHACVWGTRMHAHPQGKQEKDVIS